jgi:hypothetical protein
VFKENTQARKAYEKWGGKLDEGEGKYERGSFTAPLVYYVFDLCKG